MVEPKAERNIDGGKLSIVSDEGGLLSRREISGNQNCLCLPPFTHCRLSMGALNVVPQDAIIVHLSSQHGKAVLWGITVVWLWSARSARDVPNYTLSTANIDIFVHVY